MRRLTLLDHLAVEREHVFPLGGRGEYGDKLTKTDETMMVRIRDPSQTLSRGAKSFIAGLLGKPVAPASLKYYMKTTT